ncbi:2-oxoglutarate dehydrogenase E2 component [Balneicella halophila]|uniref:Dihydrolipoyllysine-residue succinyltransferase n=1 Tax=Balneicella halophila TaxID=1537566 RepID=A0A7L4UN40_BALHA|nr:2-oxoglutarate dehydrogenase complex dihydrolipoyllysine-residue succinyltransferase [Balneicella halophila]PVX49962.1 2-oxoglutarate dehydrogenase E2 component [Balneicella halophila]
MATIEVKIPSPGESISEVELSSWLVEDGAVVSKNAEIAEIESDKATLTLVADEGGKIKQMASEGDTLEVGAVACTIDTSVAPKANEDIKKDETPQDDKKEDSSSEEHQEEKKEPKKETSEEFSKVKVSPLARKMMDEENLSIDDIINGLRRLKSSDVEVAKRAGTQAPTATGASLKKEANRDDNRKRMSTLRRKLSQRLVSVKNETAMLTTFNEVDMSPIMKLRKKYQEKFIETHGIKLGFMSFFIKACSKALQDFPAVNGMIDGEDIVTHDYTDISVAVSTPKGLMVPVIRNVESLGLAEIENELKKLATKARDGKLSIDEMTGGTFTITNGGVFGSMMSTPIINPPQSAILGMHNIIERPVAIEGKVEIRPMMYVAVSYDHRIIDGKESVSFLVRVKELLENPENLLWDGKNSTEMLLEI